MGAMASSYGESMTADELLVAAGPVYGPLLHKKLQDASGLVSKDKLLAISQKTDVFLTHDWGVDEDGRKNHDRVARVNAGLQRLGLITWFDSERMEGDIIKMMCNGIENASVIIVFITLNYISKINSDNTNDNCQQEFLYAKSRKSPKLMLPVVMEKRCRKTNEWIGPVGMTLGNTLYVDFAVDEDLDRAVHEIYAAVLKKTRPLLAVDDPAAPSGLIPSSVFSSITPNAPVIASRKALEQLSTEEVVVLFKSLKIFDVLNVIVKQSITGEMLSFAEKEDDLRELLGITIPAVKIRLLLNKLRDYKAHGVPIESITEAMAANQNMSQGTGAAPMKGEEEEAEVWHKNDIDPCDDSDLGYSYYVSIHDHPLYRNSEDNGWGCDGRNFQEGCACGCTGFYQTERWVRFSCLPCSFDLCKGCVFKWILSEEEAVLAVYDKEDFVIGETVFVSVHDHVLHRDRADNGWACSGRLLPGGCRKGCTDYGQSAGWERFRCYGCDFNLCRECVRAYKTR
eukprot:gene2745-2998_t